MSYLCHVEQLCDTWQYFLRIGGRRSNDVRVAHRFLYGGDDSCPKPGIIVLICTKLQLKNGSYASGRSGGLYSSLRRISLDHLGPEK
eukprot:6213866-Pleurochrysis_carterae.AAC.2